MTTDPVDPREVLAEVKPIEHSPQEVELGQQVVDYLNERNALHEEAEHE